MFEGLKIKIELDRKTPFSHKKPFGKGSRKCERCNNHRGFNRKYKLNLCRRCTFNKAKSIGFKIFS